MKLVFSLGEARAFSIWEKMLNYFLQTPAFFVVTSTHPESFLDQDYWGFWALKFHSLAAFIHGRPPSGDILFHSYPCPAVQTLTIL